MSYYIAFKICDNVHAFPSHSINGVYFVNFSPFFRVETYFLHYDLIFDAHLPKFRSKEQVITPCLN